MTTQELHERLRARFGDDVGPLTEPRADPFCVVRAARIVEVCRFAKADPALALDFLEDLTAVDWPARNVIEVVYHLFSYGQRHGIVLKVEADRAAPRVPSVEGVWKAAGWFEREVYDLFGVEFAGHPDLRRIMLPDDWVGHPLRKDYQEAGGYRGIGNTRENPLVELRRLDQQARALRQAQGERPDAASAPSPAPAPAAAPATPSTPAPTGKA
jgi:NADH-quinone oxidoreductase subunit C